MLKKRDDIFSKFPTQYEKNEVPDTLGSSTPKPPKLDAYDMAVQNIKDFQRTPYAREEDYQNLIKKYQDMPDFKYDLNGDALYQQYKDKYTQQGELAMADAMGQASALTGGYGNSYAATVGNQTYQAYLGQLNDVIPELYQLAYDQDRNKKNDVLTEIALLKGERDYHHDMEDDRYNKLLDEYTLAQEKEAHDRDKLLFEMQYNTPPIPEHDNGSLSTLEVKALQAKLGVEQTGYYDAETKRAAGNRSPEDAYEIFTGGHVNKYSGSTFEDTIRYLQDAGIEPAWILESGLMSPDQWQTAKDNGENIDEVTEFATYAAYLDEFVKMALAQKYS